MDPTDRSDQVARRLPEGYAFGDVPGRTIWGLYGAKDGWREQWGGLSAGCQALGNPERGRERFDQIQQVAKVVTYSK